MKPACVHMSRVPEIGIPGDLHDYLCKPVRLNLPCPFLHLEQTMEDLGLDGCMGLLTGPARVITRMAEHLQDTSCLADMTC